MKGFIGNLVLSALFFSSLLHAINTKDSTLGENIGQEISQEPLFVSLGSTCTTAHMHRECGIRKAAFPFDWIISFDGEKLIDILEDGFLHFLNPQVLKVSGSTLLNLHYHLEYLNEGDWEDANYDIRAFSEKCLRRINRFKQLANYRGKVFFVRTAYPDSCSDPHRIWKNKENIEIKYEYADKLHKVLRQCFPNVDFTLIIMNRYGESGFLIEEKLSDDILMVRIDSTIEAHKDFYLKLLNREHELQITSI